MSGIMSIENFGTKLITIADTTALAAVNLYLELGYKPVEVEVVSLYESSETRLKWNLAMWNHGSSDIAIVNSDNSGYFFVSGDKRQTFYPGFKFNVYSSTSCDGDTQVISSTYDRDLDQTRIAVASVAASDDSGRAKPLLFGGGYVLTHASANWTELTSATGVRLYDGGQDIVYNNPATPTYKFRGTTTAVLSGQVIGEHGQNVLSEEMPARSADNGAFHRLKSGIIIPALAAIRGNAQVLTVIVRR